MRYVRQIYQIALREMQILRKNRIYVWCMVLFPILVTVFFTSLMDDGLPQDMPVGIVDMDNTSTTRSLTRRLDAFQNSAVIAHYPNVTEARHAIQRNEIYAYLYIPKGTTEKLIAGRQPRISFYYTNTALLAGTLVFKDMKVISTLGSAAVGQATMRARGYTPQQISTFLQPVKIDLHQVANPWTNYNAYLSTVLVPGCIMLFIFLITAYSIGMELKFQRSKEWLQMADNNIYIALAGKFLPQMLIFLSIVFAYQYYVFGFLGFPHHGGVDKIAMLGVLQVLCAQGFGIFVFGLMPSLRMSMSVCSLWAVLSFSMAGSAFPIMGMDGPLQSLSWLFPLRHYYMLYQVLVFNGFSLLDVWLHFVALVAFALLPILVMRKLKNAMLTYVYIP